MYSRNQLSQQADCAEHILGKAYCMEADASGRAALAEARLPMSNRVPFVCKRPLLKAPLLPLSDHASLHICKSTTSLTFQSSQALS